MPNSNQSEAFSSPSTPTSISSPTQTSTNHRTNPRPRYLRDPSTLENLSSTITGISSYVFKNLPEGLITKAKQLSSLPSSIQNSSSQSKASSPKADVIKIKPIKARPKVKVTCTHFDYICSGPGLNRRSCLLLGYADGFQVWDIDDVGNITELALVKLDIGEIRSIKVINPEDGDPSGVNILLGSVRALPISPDQEDEDFDTVPDELSILCLYSLFQGHIVSKLVYEKEVLTSIDSNKSCIVMATTLPCIRLLSRKDLSEHHVFMDVLVTPATRCPIFTLGPRLLAYSTTSETPWKSDFRENSNIVNANVKVDRVAKDMVNGIKSIGDYGYQKINNYFNSSPDLSSSPRRKTICEGVNNHSDNFNLSSSPEDKGFLKDSGRVIIRDVMDFIDSDMEHPLSPKLGIDTNLTSPSVAHFHCHYYPIACMSFNSSGNLLATSSVEGHSFYVYEILGTNPYQPPYKLLYKLSRGFTDAKVVDMAFNQDSRWLATTTKHGTTHLFQLNPYGGAPHFESHLQGKVLNPETSPSSKPTFHNQTKPFSSVSAVRIRRTPASSDANELAHEEELELTAQISTSYKDDALFSTKFPNPSTQLNNWLNRLPGSYEQLGAPDSEPRSSTIVLTVNSEGTLMLSRIIVYAKYTSTGSEEKEVYLSSKLESIAEWYLVKQQGDVEKAYSPHFLTPAVKSIYSQPHGEPESTWLPFVETNSYDPFTCPSRPLWSLGQFNFKVYLEADADVDQDEPSLCFFDKESKENKVYNVKALDLPRPFGREKVTYQPSSSFGEIEDHLVSAMQTVLDKPSIDMAIRPRRDLLSFEDAFEIHLTSPFSNSQPRSIRPITEIPQFYARPTVLERPAQAQDFETEHNLQDQFDHLEVFPIDDLDQEEEEIQPNDSEFNSDFNSDLDVDLDATPDPPLSRSSNPTNQGRVSPPLLRVPSKMDDVDEGDDLDAGQWSGLNEFHVDDFIPRHKSNSHPDQKYF